MFTLYTQETVTELYGKEMQEKGYSEAYLSAVRENLISREIAADKLGISVAELESRLEDSQTEDDE